MADDLQKPPVSGSDLYERDYLAWTEVQARALRARTGGENALDYDNLAEEIEDLGKSEFYGCQSFVERIIEHLLKLEFTTDPDPRAHWRGEIVEFRSQLDDHLTRTIENRLRERLDTLFARRVVKITTAYPSMNADMIRASRPEGYLWSEIIDPDWYPEPIVD